MFETIDGLKIDYSGPALSSLPWFDGTRGVVRRTDDGMFAVIETDGYVKRVRKVYTTLAAARAIAAAGAPMSLDKTVIN